MKRFLAICLLLVWLPSCIPATIGISAYAIGRGRTKNAYRKYVTDLEKTNQERIDKGLKPIPIATFEEWKKK